MVLDKVIKNNLQLVHVTAILYRRFSQKFSKYLKYKKETTMNLQMKGVRRLGVKFKAIIFFNI